jgi:hypothetical protein
MAFRLQAVHGTTGELTGSVDRSGLVVRDGYPAPCKHLSTPYPVPATRVGSGGAR